MNESSSTAPADANALQAEIERLRAEVAALDAALFANRHVTAGITQERDAYRAAFDGNPVMQIWLDRHGGILRINKAAMTAAGLDGLPSGMTVFNDPVLIMLGVPAYFEKALTGQTVRMPRYAFNPSHIHLGAPDAALMLETVLHPVFGSGENVTGVVVQHFDMTALDAAEKEAARLRILAASAG
jgi:PAS domain-containing protein